MRKIRVRVMYIIYSIKNINKLKLGDSVMYKNERCSVIQGVSNPYWDLLPMSKENLDKPKRDIHKRVHQDNFIMQPLRNRFRFSFLSTYNFLMSNWYYIDVRKKGSMSYKF